LFVLVNNVITFFLVPDPDLNNDLPLVPILATLMIAVGGFFMVVAYHGGGGPEMVNRAKTIFRSVIIGLLIAYGAWIIVGTFFSVVGVVVWGGFGEWWEIPC